MSQIEPVAGYIPELKALKVRLSVFVRMRWLVVIGIIAVTLSAEYIFNISFQTLPVYILCVFVLAYNLWMYLWNKQLVGDDTEFAIRRAQTNGYIQVLLDLGVLTVLLHFTGGITNPFIFVYVIHTTAASILLTKRRAYILTTIAVGMAALLAFLEYSGSIGHVALAGFIPDAIYQQLNYVSSIILTLAVLTYTSTYITTAVAGELREQHLKVDQLRDRLQEEDKRELQRVSNEVEHLKDERTNFVRLLYVVTHDLKAPLVAVQSCISYVLDGYAGDANGEQKDWLQRASRRIDGLLLLITDLLDIPRIELGQLKQEMTELPLNEVIIHSLEGLEIIAQKKGLQFQVELPPESPVIYGSSRRLQQVITNLTNNAINYTKVGSITIRLSENENEVKVEFIDTGIGIPPKDLPKLFDEFYRGSNVESKGSGLGLSITRRIILAHGGKIRAESPVTETGLGSKFVFTIPKQKKENTDIKIN
jgi:signal transduction histidine kinase